MAKERQKEGEVFFVGIKEPVEIRRSMLEASKSLLQYMQRFEEFKERRAEKQTSIAQLREVTADIARLINKLRIELPKTKLRAKSAAHEEVKKVEIPKPVTGKAKPKIFAKQEKEASEFEKLESELAEIEERLTKLK